MEARNRLHTVSDSVCLCSKGIPAGQQQDRATKQADRYAAVFMQIKRIKGRQRELGSLRLTFEHENSVREKGCYFV